MGRPPEAPGLYVNTDSHWASAGCRNRGRGFSSLFLRLRRIKKNRAIATTASAVNPPTAPVITQIEFNQGGGKDHQQKTGLTADYSLGITVTIRRTGSLWTCLRVSYATQQSSESRMGLVHRARLTPGMSSVIILVISKERLDIVERQHAIEWSAKATNPRVIR